MSKKIEDTSQDYIAKMRGRKRALSKNTLIWTISIMIGIAFIVVGVIDYNADYDIVATTSPIDVQVTTNGEVTNKTLYPIFGRVSVPKVGGGGFLPSGIGLTMHDWIILGIIFMLGVPSFAIYEVEGRKLKGIDDNLPYLLREVADSQRIGMTLPRAITEASKRNYGPLTPELKKLAAKISWGIPFRDAMRSFRDNVNTPLARQATILILEAERSGGELEKIFDSAQNYVQELLSVKKERESAIRPYIYIIFVSYIIFIVVVLTLFTTFFAPFGVQEIQTQDGQSIVAVPLDAFKVAFLYLLMIQALFSGLVAGKMGRAKVKFGLFYSTTWMILGILAYKLIIIPGVEEIEAGA